MKPSVDPISPASRFRLDAVAPVPQALSVDKKLERKPLAVQLADRLEDAIRSGQWTSRLPGNRTLASHFTVNRKTCAAAMNLLQQRGLIGAAEVGKRREILPLKNARSTTRKSTGRLLILYPASLSLNRGDEDLLRSFETAWENSFGGVVWTKVDFERYRNPEPVLEKLIERHQADALLLYVPPGTWSEVAAERLPSFQVGGTHGTSLKFSMCSFSINAQMERVTRHLAGLGHRRILLPLDSLMGSASLRRAFTDGLSKGLGAAPEPLTFDDLCPRFPEPHPAVWQSYWERAFDRVRPTAVVITEDVYLLSLYGFCAHHGIRIPENLSIISINYEQKFEWCRPKPAMLRFPNRMALSHFKTWLTGGLRPIGKHFLEMEFLEGESIAPACA